MKRYRVEVEREDDGRWIADVIDLPGCMVYGSSEREAMARAQALALAIFAERLEHGEIGDDLVSISFERSA